jgi:hypothetical protein
MRADFARVETLTFHGSRKNVKKLLYGDKRTTTSV